MKDTPFSLVKWYMDCVTEQGDTVILYCAELRWHGVHAHYSSVLSGNEDAVETHSSLSRHSVQADAERISVELPRFGISGCWTAVASPFEHTVYENASGKVQWNCMQPKSSVSLHISGRELCGLGYAECLCLTLPPWQLPMRQLRWGRFVSPQDSLVWIDWQGPYNTSVAFCNGKECILESVSDAEIVTQDAALHIEAGLPLRAGRLGETILPSVPALGKLLPGSLFHIEERKWRSRGVLQTKDHRSNGWVIHELVHWEL